MSEGSGFESGLSFEAHLFCWLAEASRVVCFGAPVGTGGGGGGSGGHRWTPVDTGGGTGDPWHALHAIITLDFVFCVI